MIKSKLNSALALIVTLVVTGSAVAYWTLRINVTKPEAAKTTAPASQTKVIKESELNLITLTADAETRLGIQTQPLAMESIAQIRIVGGEMLLPTGRALIITAPFAGTIKLASESILPGQPVKKGQPLFSVLPLLTTEARTAMVASLLDAEGLIKSAEVQLKAALVSLDRAKALVAGEAGSKKLLDDAQAAFDLAQKTSEAATARRDLLSQTIKGADAGSVTAIKIDSPDDGIIRNIQAGNNQLVSAGAALVEIMNTDVLWVRVPVYVGELREIDMTKPAMIGRLGAAGELIAAANPVAAPPTATSLNSTRDLWYQLDNKAGQWASGQRISVSLPGNAAADSLVIAWSAVVFDINGGAWVYQKTADRTYVRQRVQVRQVIGGKAVLLTGPPVGTVIVTQGVAELFGREMGFAK